MHIVRTNEEMKIMLNLFFVFKFYLSKRVSWLKRIFLAGQDISEYVIVTLT